MKNSEIISSLKGTAPSTQDVEQAFQMADQQENFSAKFEKTKSFWGEKEWAHVAKSVRAKM